MSDPPQPAQTLRSGRYAVVGELGAGSQAETLDAVDKQGGRAVAIKRFQVRGAKGWKDVELAEREARVLSTLSHPNLPVYLEHFEENGALYLVMEKIEGETLAALRRRKSRLSQEDIARFLSDAASALGYLHSRVPPIIHRDIKPGNVIQRADGSFAFVDFGSVRDQLKPEGGSTVAGTFGYMAPEQFQGRALPGSDVYAVAATALSLVTGREPEDLPHRGLAIDVAAALGRGADPGLLRVLSAMLEPNPDKRPARVTTLRPQRNANAERAERNLRAERERTERERAEQSQRREREDWNEGPWDPRSVREVVRAQRRQMKAETRRIRHDLQAQIRDEARRLQRQARQFNRARPEHWHRHAHGFGPAAPLLITIIVFGLLIARMATWALFRFFLPTLLGLLSIVFGRGMRRAAWRMREVGVQGDAGLQHAIHAVRGRILGRDEIEVEPAGDEAPWRARDSHPAEPRERTRVDSGRLRVDPSHAPKNDDTEVDPLDDAADSTRRQPR